MAADVEGYATSRGAVTSDTPDLDLVRDAPHRPVMWRLLRSSIDIDMCGWRQGLSTGLSAADVDRALRGCWQSKAV